MEKNIHLEKKLVMANYKCFQYILWVAKTILLTKFSSDQ